MLDEDAGSLKGWLYPLVMDRLHRRTWLSDHLGDAFDGATMPAKLASGLAGASSVEQFVNFVTLCTNRRAIDCWRKANRVSRREAQLNEDSIQVEGETPSASEAAIAAELALHLAVQSLTDKEKELYELCRQGLRPREIAVALGWTPATVWTRRSELKKKLRAIMTAHQSGYTCE